MIGRLGNNRLEGKNVDIKQLCIDKKVYQWQVADELGISEMTLSRKLRYELPKNERQKIMNAIDSVANKNKEV